MNERSKLTQRQRAHVTCLQYKTKTTQFNPTKGSIEFFLNVFTEFVEFSDKYVIILKRLFKPATSV